MRENKRADNVRLIRLPNGQLVTEQQAADLKKLKQLDQKQKNIERELELKHYSEKLAIAEKKQLQKNSSNTPKNSTKEEKDILNVWKKQEDIKRETERLEIEYELAKKMARDLKRKLKEQRVPHEGQNIDEAFKDLLSPEAKNLASKLKPAANKAKKFSKQAIKSSKITANRYYGFGKLLYKKNKIATIAGASVVLLMIGGMGYLVFRSKPAKVSVSEVQGASDQSKIPTNVTPDFATLLPADKTIEDLGGFAKVSPENSASAYAFKDLVGNVPIIVTQQVQPDGLKEQQKIEDFAKANNLTKNLQIDDKTIYIGKSDKGPQSLMFIKDGNLVFIKAEQEVDEVSWVQYVTNLVKK